MAEEDAARIAVADASFLIGICFIDQLALLAELFERVYVAPAVWNEVVLRGKGRPGAEQIVNSECIQQHNVQNQQAVAALQVFLGPGEAESLVLAQELACPLALMDELRARKAAQQSGLRTLGVLGLLLAAKDAGHIAQIRPSVDALLTHGFRLSNSLIERVLREAGEL